MTLRGLFEDNRVKSENLIDSECDAGHQSLFGPHLFILGSITHCRGSVL